VKNKFFVVLILFFTALWIAGFSIFSFLPKDSSLQAFYPLSKMTYGRVCHQDVDKSFLVNGFHFLVCSRCTGIYLGAFIGIFIYLFSIRKYLVDALGYLGFFYLLLMADVIANNYIFTSYNKTTAFFSGYLFSFIAVNFVILELKKK